MKIHEIKITIEGMRGSGKTYIADAILSYLMRCDLFRAIEIVPGTITAPDGTKETYTLQVIHSKPSKGYEETNQVLGTPLHQNVPVEPWNPVKPLNPTRAPISANRRITS